MRIAVIIESFPVVSETFVSNKVKNLCERGHEVFVFCNNIDSELFEKIFGNSTVKVILFSKSGLGVFLLLHPWRLVASLKNIAALRRRLFLEYRLHMINHRRCDIVHFEFSGVGLSYLGIMEKLKAKKIVSCRGTAENVNLALDKNRQQGIQTLFEKIDAVHCVSAALKKLILPYCFYPQKIFVIEPAVETAFFTKQPTVYEEKVPLILSVGRFTFQKGYLFGILAIKKLKEMYADFKWIIVGEGAQYEEMLFLIHDMKLQDHILLVGKKSREEVVRLYNKASIFFLPSITEGIANVVLEAMSMQLPVVSTTCGGMEEVISHGVNGLLSDVYDQDHLADNLLQLLKDKYLRERLGIQARQTVVEKFDTSMQIAKFEQMYRQLAMQEKTATTALTYSFT